MNRGEPTFEICDSEGVQRCRVGIPHLDPVIVRKKFFPGRHDGRPPYRAEEYTVQLTDTPLLADAPRKENLFRQQAKRAKNFMGKLWPRTYMHDDGSSSPGATLNEPTVNLTLPLFGED